MANEEIIKRIRQNNAHGEEIVRFIQKELPLLKQNTLQKRQEKLAAEIQEKNSCLKTELEYWIKRVADLETINGIKQYPLPSTKFKANTVAEDNTVAIKSMEAKCNTDTIQTPIPKAEDQKQGKKEVRSREGKKEKTPKAAKSDKPPTEENKDVNVSRLDLRIGRILNAKNHPDAENLYVEEIDVGEDKPRTVVSGLVKFVPLEEMQNRLVVVLCNLKAAKMRGITSEAMVMCASTPEKVEILAPPQNSAPGDRVICDEYQGEPDSLLNPKKKIFEQVAPDLKTDASGTATYKSAPLKVASKGVVKSATLINVQIK